jgi:hypothetical protein
MKTIPFSGIVLDTSNPQDGQLTAMVNLRHTSTGSISPTGVNKKIYTISNHRELIYIHKGNGYENWITFDGRIIYYEAYRYGNDNVVRPMYYYDGESSGTKIGVPIYQIDSLNDITSVGNTLVVLTDDGIFYFLCYLYGSSGTYVYKDISINEDDITVKINQTERSVYRKNNISFPYDVVARYVACSGETPKGEIYEPINKLKSDGCIQNVSLIRWAVRMYDGTHILHSAPILLMVRMPIGIHGFMDSNYKNRSVSADYAYYKIKIDITIPKTLKESEIYKGIDVFMAEIPYYDDTDTYKNDLQAIKVGNNYSFGGDPFYTSDEKLRERILETANFYRIAQYDFDSDKFNGNTLSDIPDLSDILKNLVYQPALTDDTYSHNKLIAEKIFNYNSKLHISGTSQKLYDGYPVEMFISYAGSTVDVIRYISRTYIKAEAGTSIVVRDQDLSDGESLLLLSPYITYPDSRAYQMEIAIIYESGGTRYLYSAKFDLKPHDFLNLSYYLPTGEINPITISGTVITEIPEAPQSSNNIESTPNKLKVSAADNPFIFPVEQTYTVGNGKIIGLAAATPALSQGQYGQFPLYVFTDEGIYMLQVGAGEVIYTNCFPVSRDICDNPDSIISLDNAVAFTSDRKLFVLSGYSAKSISDSLEADYIPNPAHVYMEGIENVLTEPLLAYNYPFGELIIKNTEANTAFIYDLQRKIWRQRKMKASYFIPSYPVCYAVSDKDEVYDLSQESNQLQNVTICTAPITLGTPGFKKIERSILRMLAGGHFSISIYASNDNKTFYKVISVNINSDTLLSDILLPRIPSSWRNFYLFIEGDMLSDSTITRLDIQEKNTFNTKLR